MYAYDLIIYVNYLAAFVVKFYQSHYKQWGVVLALHLFFSDSLWHFISVTWDNSYANPTVILTKLFDDWQKMFLIDSQQKYSKWSWMEWHTEAVKYIDQLYADTFCPFL